MAATSSRQLKNICVLSGFRYGKYKEFVQAAIDLGRAIAERKLHLVYGGGSRGLSKLVSEAAFVRGSQVLGIIPKALKPLGCLPDPPTGEELVVSAKKLFICAPTVNELLDLLQAYKPEPDPMTLALDWAIDDNGSIKMELELKAGIKKNYWSTIEEMQGVAEAEGRAEQRELKSKENRV
ncbi:hypothetical protein WN943_003473 [Citrus x changshan-huyou]